MGNVAHIRKKTNACRVLMRKPEEMRPLARRKHRWEDTEMILNKRGGRRCN
jgi:hypothetical protein